MKRHILFLDLKDDADLIAAYEDWHRKVWPEVIFSIKDSGITNMEIFRCKNRLVMLMETGDDFSFERKSAMDSANEKVQEWEQLMNNFQQQIPGSAAGEKWQIGERVFALSDF